MSVREGNSGATVPRSNLVTTLSVSALSLAISQYF